MNILIHHTKTKYVPKNCIHLQTMQNDICTLKRHIEAKAAPIKQFLFTN